MTAGARYAWLPAAVAGDALIVTPSRRLQRELLRAHGDSRLAAGQRAWRTPDIRHWQDWLADTLDEAGQEALPRLLDPAAATLLWEESLDRTARQGLLNVHGAVRHAQAAWSRLADYRVSAEAVADAAQSRDEHWYVRAAAAYRRRLEAGQLVDAAELARVCTENRQLLRWPRRLVVAGFERMPPALAALLAALRDAGVAVDEAPVPARGGAVEYASFADPDSMWRAAGAWARRTLREAPGLRVAIVVPDLETDAPRIARLVREGFAPGWQLGGARYRDAVNLSYGRRLAAYPAIAAALATLEFAAIGLDSPAAGLLLTSPFLAAGGQGGRARLERRLRELPQRRWLPAELLAAVDRRRHAADGRDFRDRCQALVELSRRRGERLSPGRWAAAFDQALTAVGWPGPVPPDSDEFQLVNRWRQLLNQFARLASVRPLLRLDEALRRLARMAADTLYQPEAADGALDVLGLLETAGLEFDRVFVGGMDATRWPPPPGPLALVNRRLQREAGLPDATPAEALAFAERTLARLLGAAGAATVAFARADGDVELAPSPLLAAPVPVAADADDPGWFAAGLRGRRVGVADDPVPPVMPGEQVRGGAYTVQRQQEEPFAAFAAGRLGVERLEPWRPGLAPRQRGILVHAALQELYAELPTQQDIGRWTDVAERCGRAAARAVAGLRRHADAVLGSLLDIEQARLARLLVRFLAWECDREPFAVVALEAERELRRGDLRLVLRIDRIDRLDDGTLLLADYKTGSEKRFLGQDRQPKTAQMSVYAAAVDEPVGALAFINVDSRGIGYDGAGRGFASGRVRIDADDWPGVLEGWRADVDALLARLAAGDIGVNLRQSADDARPLALLSRVEELRREL